MRHCTTRDVPILFMDTLRLGIITNEDGEPETLVIAYGHGEGKAWKEDPAAGGLELPVEILRPLIKGLQALDGDMGRRGAVMLLFLFFIPVAIVLGALVIDLGIAFVARAEAVRAADAAALAGALGLHHHGLDSAYAWARDLALKNNIMGRLEPSGVQVDADTLTRTVGVQVRAEGIPGPFSATWGHPGTTVGARATAAVNDSGDVRLIR